MTETWTVARLGLLGAGVALVGVGVVVGLTSVPQGQWPSVLLWLAGGVAVHDAVLAPAAVVLGALVRLAPRCGFAVLEQWHLRGRTVVALRAL